VRFVPGSLFLSFRSWTLFLGVLLVGVLLLGVLLLGVAITGSAKRALRVLGVVSASCG
jgi:hypothetical protein